MTLAAGSKLGPYEILDQIGAGGMGEVYRAKDPRLGREVAIKVLPVSPALIAMGFQALGDKDQAFDWWAKACEDHSVDVKYLKVDPMNDNLRDDPRFADLLRKAGLGP